MSTLPGSPSTPVAGTTIATMYAEFAARETHGISPAYERLSLAVSHDDELLDLIETLPLTKRQPNLLYGVVRFLGGPVEDPAAFHHYTVTNWARIEVEVRSRATQTNEPGRCAVLLPVLASLPQPLALLEVGASAGLCLYPDRYAYRYGDHLVGAGYPVIECAATGVVPPAAVPEVVWRAGLDLNPLKVTDSADVAWLDALIWPEHAHRRARLRAAAAVARAEPPMLVRGDLVDDLPSLAAQAPAGATLVVFHTSVMYHVPAARRAAFVEVVARLPGHWIANEAPDVLAHESLPATPGRALHNVLALDGDAAGLDPVARTGTRLVRVTVSVLVVGQRSAGIRRLRATIASMRLATVLVLVWLLIGVLAAAQRNYFSGGADNCAHVSTTAVRIIAGPLNYVGVNPKVECKVPQPSE